MAFRDLILHNFRRKLLALAVATLIWLTIHVASQDANRSRTGQQPLQTNSFTIE